ncbi:TrlF family AAA-like ATPase [Flavobacterium rhizosphaerae]|uniref:TrlF family AAA-like ATPase n=1 Tax=Flavobacterium rhizosphaerae TaxID=3163298 RepID=A0ABW8YYT0_9FLAO
MTINNQAKFYRGDIHIHSFGQFGFGSYDVSDTTMTPQAIVDTAIEKNLQIISITDHNEINNSFAAIDYAKDKNILVIPGIEVTTTQGHLLVYFETFDQLRAFNGKLNYTSDRKLCNQGIVECLNFANQDDGFGILAHIELTSGFEQMIGRFGPQIEEILKIKNLLGFEISSKTSINFYTDLDTSDKMADRCNLMNIRRAALEQDAEYNLPKIMSSDSHTLSKLGINADGENKLTRYKVDELNYHSIKIALQYHESRIRLENEIPEVKPHIKSIKIEGGLFKDVEINLSSNLTCIIGGRGAGKSTLLEAIREATGNKSKAGVVDSDVWPQKINIVYYDEANRRIDFAREKNSSVRNITDPINGINKVEIETYGQGETAETLQHSDENPQILINFLDSFLNIEDKILQEKIIINQLLENQSSSKKIRLELLSYDATVKALNNEQKKLNKLKQEKAGELVEYQNALIKERQIRKDLISKLNDLIKTYREILSDNTAINSLLAIPEDEISIGKDFFINVKNILSDFSGIVEVKSTELNAELSKKIEDLKIQLKSWGDKESEIQSKIDAKKAELEEQGIPFDLGKINQISKDILDYQKKIEKLDLEKLDLEKLNRDRQSLIENRKVIKDEIFEIRKSFKERANKTLKNTIDGFFITIKYKKGLFSQEFEELLKSKMDWRQNRKSKIISSHYSIPEFLKICHEKDYLKFTVLKDAEENQIFSQSESQNIINKILSDYNFEDFESLFYDDMPEVTVTKSFMDNSGNPQYIVKPLSKLSLGQQQSVLLGILMLSDSNRPLIIDQPEDNLDSEFIFKTIVKNLRKIKEQRQVIIVTHNPNIAVLGDAELIIPLKSTSMLTHVTDPGSIDRTETRLICCEILEGGKRAFKQREMIYGIK